LGNILVVGSAWKQRTIDPKGLIFRTIAAAGLTAGILLDAANSANFSVSLYSFMAYFGAGVFTWILGWVSVKEIVEEVKTNWRMH